MNVNIRDWTFTHWWVRPTVKVWFDLYHKSVIYSGVQNIDWDKPIIFAPSHQNAFTDALCLILPTEYTNNRFIYPLIRADAFGNNKALDWMLTVFHMLPVYRPRDNVNLMQRNESVFSHCHEILYKNRNLLIHPEGNCIPKKQVGRFKKGLARIALGAEAEKNFNLGVNVIPVGINYREIAESRNGIHVQFGNPILVSDYKESYAESEVSAITDLTRAVEQGVREVTVDIDTNDYQLTDELLKLLKENSSQIDTAADYSREEVNFEKNTISKLKSAEKHDPKLTHYLKKTYERLYSILDEYNLDIEVPIKEKKPWRLISEGVGYLVLLPIVLYGWINNIIPWFLMNKVADKVKEKQFKNSARMISGLLIFPICYLIQTAILGIVTGVEVELLLYLISLPITGIITLKISESVKRWIQQLRLKKISQKKQQELSELLNEITDSIEKPAELDPSSDPT